MAEPVVSRLTIALLVLAFSAWHWARLERPVMDPAELGVLCGLALVPGLAWALRRNRLALAAALPLAIWGAVWVTFDYQPWARNHPFYLRRVYDGIRDGAHSWFDTVTPFDPGRFPATGALVELTFFALAALFAWLVLDGRLAIPAIGAAFALFAIPSTAGSFHSPGFRAAVFLALAVGVLAVMQLREPLRGAGIVQLTALGAAAVICGLVLGGAPAVAKGAFLDWRNWNPLIGEGPRADVGYVWDQSYGPLRWPKQKLTMFEAESPRPVYWKAAVLTEFEVDRWKAAPIAEAPLEGTDVVGVPPSVLPPKASRPDHTGDIIISKFKIKGLADNHLLTPGQGMAWSLDRTVDAVVNTDGSAQLSRDASRNQEYQVRSYSPDPTAAQLAGADGIYPDPVASGVTINGHRVPVWGTIGGVPQKIFAGILDPRLVAASNEAWVKSDAYKAKTQYAAVLALEQYFRSAPFTYTQTPRYKGNMPVLAEFILETPRGYCQMFSGAMAFVLRMHGIPARVAVGFTEGTQSRADHYVVKDRNAHAWVETYFPGYGWVPFEPTPGRALQLLASSSDTRFGNNFQGLSASTALSNIGLPNGAPTSAIATLLARAGVAGGGPGSLGNKGSRGSAAGATGGVPDASSKRVGFLTWLVVAVAVIIAALAALKFAAVRWRWLRRGPRGQASAAFHELSTYLGDQGVSVPQNATFEELAKLVHRSWGIDASALATAGSAARYAPPRTAARAGRDVRPQLRKVKRELRRNVPRSDRASGALRLRSALSQTTHLD